MNRRNFFKSSVQAGILAGTALSMSPAGKLFAKDFSTQDYDLVAIKNGSPQAMLDRGLQSIGGIKKFIKPGQSVVVKPNIGWDAPPERAANTNPQLVKRIVEHCITAGASRIYVFDNTCDNWQKCYDHSGIKSAVSSLNNSAVKIITGNSETHYRPIRIAGAKVLKEAKVHEKILEADVFINVPVLKHHGGATLTISMKNLMGIVWDRRYWHRNGLHQCIADFCKFRKPDLNIVDAYRVMKRNGPRGVSTKDVVLMKSQIISTDIVAADAASSKLFGKEPDQVKYINLAHEMNIGEKNTENLNIDRIIL